ncbi:WcbI family polysaccharide biosynthesis putative acetyltransferase [Falsarthrobacter nasiphocae]|uniref:Polysaccharide biosynthesis enzyme WcbI domain-containing protein n=1 Tax=Falsarthrobacter nasiphocae TaxID=189863 RepID=A0AAE3YCU2_9MICC|nr:WcbI family polysaccharide biosynthesis putative acetyltransferase [Falsarthrobacter nasiphocae]MDR6891528.1 hypothetical protein [Falsarthrobacter nasiphocae]
MDPLDAARRRHFGHFYGLDGLPDGDSPFVVVHGNCQAGSLRRLIEAAGARAVRIPPVHELAPDDVPLLHALVARADALVSQPVAAGYHDLPLGVSDLAALLPAGAPTVLVPVLRFAGHFPFQVTVRPSFAPSIDPPLVPYHDLRTIIVASEFPRERAFTPAMAARFEDLTDSVTTEAVQRVAAASVEAMAVRERHHGTVAVSPVLAGEVRLRRTHHTLNHPTNAFFESAAVPVIAALAEALGGGAGLDPSPSAPEAEMLGGIRARIEPVAERAFPGAVTAGPWTVGGEPLADDALRDAQLAWYRDNPGFVDAGLARHADTLALLGLPC